MTYRCFATMSWASDTDDRRGNGGQTLKAMLASVDGVATVTLGDNAGRGNLHVDVGTGENLATFVREHAIVNALPFYLNKPVASACAEAGRSYFDFSEDTESTAFVNDLARDEKRIVFVPPCGLAPALSTSSEPISSL